MPTDIPPDQFLPLIRTGVIGPILKDLCEVTSLGFAAVAMVQGGVWTACAVHNEAGYDIAVGTRKDAGTMLCTEVCETGEPIAIDKVSTDPVFSKRPEPKLVGYESYIATPITLESGERFGTLCAWDNHSALVSDAKTRLLFTHFARQIAREIDAQRSGDAALRELLDERAGGVSRERFIAILGHDLRNPLSSISSCGQVLKAKSRDPLVLQMADRIAANVDRMAVMIANLVDLARGQQGGGMRVVSQPIDRLGPAIESVIDELRVTYPHRELTSQIVIDRPVTGDKGRIQQLVSNLVANGLTHGSADSPVSVKALTLDGHLTIEVHNEGEPIPPETMPGLFDAYVRQAPAEGSAPDGLGLGLYIAEQIATAHGGKLEVQSSEAGGTVFTATLPRERPESSSEESPSKHQSPSSR